MSNYSDDFEQDKPKGGLAYKPTSKIDKNSEEYKTAYELELWKRSEEAKFKTHLKQVELETIENVTKEWRMKEQKRDDILNRKINDLEAIEKKMRQKMQDLQKREAKIVQLEEELKHKVQEVSRQLGNKEEEIINIKKRFKDEKLGLQSDIKSLKKQVENAKGLLDQTETNYRAYRKDMEESPVTVMRTEINNKNLEIADLNSRFEKAQEEIANSNLKFKKLRQDHTRLRRDIERIKTEEKEKLAEENERYKMEIKNQQLAEQDRQQVLILKEELTNVQTKLMALKDEEENRNQMMYISGVGGNTLQTQNNMQTLNSNPFGTQNSFKNTIASKNSRSPGKQQRSETKVEELTILRQNLLDSCNYTAGDAFIQNLDEQIKAVENMKSPNRDARA
mmetsp:Transcript_32371/g.28667  ORF Transcript_32371/g.28667 Transcript_32371/m.28667 type:complete len:393 (-) Transcript_32371:29-1207(-)